MNRDPVLQLLTPLAWVVLAAFLLGFAGVLAISAPILSHSASVVAKPALIAAPDSVGWNTRRSI